MKIAIKEDSDTRLKIRLTPIYLAVYLLVGVLCVVGAWFIIKVLAVTITISVNDGKLSYEHAFLGKYETKSHSVAAGEIEKIEVKVPEDSGSTEIVVSAAGSSFTMPLVSEGGDGKERIASEIGQALMIPGSEYVYVDSSLWLGLILGVVVLLAGLLTLAFVQTSVVDVDRASGKLTVRRQLWLLPFVRSSRTIETSEIQNVELSSFTVWGRGGAVESYNVVIQTHANDSVPVAYGPLFREGSAMELKSLLKKVRAKRKKKK